LLAGDELGHSQGGNNNAYCQDNETTWLDWSFLHTPQEHAPDHLLPFVRALSALRRELPALRYPQWWTGQVLNEKQCPWPDVVWLDRYGQPLDALDWNHQQHRTLCALVTVGDSEHPPTERVLIVWHADWITRKLQLPQGEWQLRLDSASAWVQTGAAASQGNELSSIPSMTQLDTPTVRVLVQALQAPAPVNNEVSTDTEAGSNSLLQRFRPSKK
jgi:glycogen operon protein